MKQFAAMQALISSSKAKAIAAGDDEKLELYLGRSWDETYQDIRLDTLSDGLSREQMFDLVRDRAFILLNIESLAHCVADVVSSFTPLANDLAEVDFAILTVGEWLAKLGEEDVFQRIVELKKQASEIGLDDGPSDPSPEAIAAWEECFDAFCKDAEAGQIQFEVGGRDILITVEHDATLIIVEREPKTNDLEVLVIFQHSIGDGDDWRDDGDDEPDPDPETGPALPHLVNA